MMASAAKGGFDKKVTAVKKAAESEEGEEKGGWGNALAAYVLHPEKHGEAVYHHDQDTVVIYDKYPKARVHLLVMPTRIITSYAKLSKADLPTLRSMQERGQAIIDEYQTALLTD